MLALWQCLLLLAWIASLRRSISHVVGNRSILAVVLDALKLILSFWTPMGVRGGSHDSRGTKVYWIELQFGQTLLLVAVLGRIVFWVAEQPPLGSQIGKWPIFLEACLKHQLLSLLINAANPRLGIFFFNQLVTEFFGLLLFLDMEQTRNHATLLRDPISEDLLLFIRSEKPQGRWLMLRIIPILWWPLHGDKCL